MRESAASVYDAAGARLVCDNFHSLDLRLRRELVIEERWRLALMGEAFNLYNAANLSGYRGDLTRSDAFGQPTSALEG